MKRKLLDSFYASIEWRLIALVITNIFFWITTESFWQATGLALLLQSVLLVAHMLWYFWRRELHMPFFPHFRHHENHHHGVH